MKPDLSPAPLTYTERAGKMSLRARRTAFQKAAEYLEAYKANCVEIGALRVSRMNSLREAGQQFNIGSGREQLSFGLDGIEFTRKEILPLMPEGIGINEVHACVLIAAKMPLPAQTVAEVDALEKAFQHEFEMLGLTASHKRKELQSPQARNLFSDFVNITSGLALKLADLEKEEPMEKWPPAKLDEFLQTAQPVKEKISRAESLRLGLVKK